jgi:hypothetical protein
MTATKLDPARIDTSSPVRPKLDTRNERRSVHGALPSFAFGAGGGEPPREAVRRRARMLGTVLQHDAVASMD